MEIRRQNIINNLQSLLNDRQLEIKPLLLEDMAEFMPRPFSNWCILHLFNRGRNRYSIMSMPWESGQLPDLLEIINHMNFNVVEIAMMVRKLSPDLSNWQKLLKNDAAIDEAEFRRHFPDLVKVSKGLPLDSELEPASPDVLIRFAFPFQENMSTEEREELIAISEKYLERSIDGPSFERLLRLFSLIDYLPDYMQEFIRHTVKEIRVDGVFNFLGQHEDLEDAKTLVDVAIELGRRIRISLDADELF